VDVSGFNTLRAVSSLTTRWLSAKRKEILDNVKLALGIAKESYGPFSPLKATIGDISTIIKQYEVLVKRMAVTHS
jgi:hypothetical protein